MPKGDSTSGSASKGYASVRNGADDESGLESSISFSRNTEQPESTKRRGLAAPDPTNEIYHLVVFSEVWWVVFIVLHLGQFVILYSSAYDGLTTASFVILLLLSITVVGLVVASRMFVKKSRLSLQRNLRIKGGKCTPEDEADDVSNTAIYCVTAACILEGISYAIYSAVLAGKKMHLSKPGYYSQGTILETLRFSSIVLLALHRIFRPANRVDPMRTILEVRCIYVDD
jgi:hypothetical protein